MTPETQESVETDQTAGAVAEETSSPDVTEGTSSSDVAAEEPTLEDIFAEEAVKEFKEKHGDPTDDEAETSDAEPETQASDAEQKEEFQTDKDDGDDDEFRLSDSDFKSLPDGAKKRIGHLNARAKKAERQLTELTSELESARDAKAALDKIRQFVQENQMDQEAVAFGLGVQAKLSTGDYEGFLKDMVPIIEMAQQALGKTFAPDLNEQVENGYMSEEAARELTKARLEAKRAREQQQKLQSQHQQMTEEQTRQQVVQHIVSAVNTREAELRQSDPDYAQKAPVVRQYMEYAMKNGARPQSADAAIQMINDAYKFASSQIAQRPAPKATPPRPSTSSVSRGNPAPQSLEDALAMSNPPQV